MSRYPYTKICKFCGKDELRWVLIEDKWKLFDKNGQIHSCNKLGNYTKIPDELAKEIKKCLTKNIELDVPMKTIVDDSKMIEGMKNKLKQRKIQKQSKHNAFKRAIIMD